MNDPVQIRSRLGPSVWVGTGLLNEIASFVPMRPERAAVLADEALPPSYAASVVASFEKAGIACVHVPLPAGETAKTLAVVERIAETLARAGMHRGDLVAGVGGGAATDVSGLVAATFARGIAWCAVPTSLLGMVDAAIGGKTAVNLTVGKNLLGVFHQPVCVVSDVETLATLSDDEFRSGMAEVIKHGMIGDPAILDDAGMQRDSNALAGLVARAARVKVDIVDEDPTERGVRAHLNYGHTLGHALETLGQSGAGPARRHGEAVAIGMVFAAHLARTLGRKDLVDVHRNAVAAASLPAGGAGVTFEDLTAVMTRDKKWEQGLRFVLLEDLGRPRVVDSVPQDAVRAAYEEVR